MPGSSFVTRVSIYYAQFKNAASSTFLQAINAPKKKKVRPIGATFGCESLPTTIPL